MSIVGTDRADDQEPPERLECVVLPHLDAAYTLARWLTKNEDDASDVVQDACLRALRFAAGFKGVNSRAWFLSIVRNTAYTWLKARHSSELELLPDDAQIPSGGPGPDEAVLQALDLGELRAAIEELPAEFREVIVLREIQELSYDDVAKIAGIPIGTVMSRLARGRARLQARMARNEPGKGNGHGL